MRIKQCLSVVLVGWCFLTRTISYEQRNGDVEWEPEDLKPGPTVQYFVGTPVKQKKMKLDQTFYPTLGDLLMRHSKGSGLWFTQTLDGSTYSSPEPSEVEDKLIWTKNEKECTNLTLDKFEKIPD